jgi:ribosomal protein S18 acetylase RimI-like enzyme
MAEEEMDGSDTPTGIALREASALDIAAIAALHADSWQRHYRGAFRNAFLDGDIVADRQAVWTERFTDPGGGQFTVVADYAGEVVGFVHIILDADPHWGALLDNLHVTYRLKRRGIGLRLLTEAAHRLLERRPADSRFFLWVLNQNVAAQKFYAAAGGQTVETTLSEPFPGGGRARCHRVAWPDAALLVARPAHAARVDPGTD